MANPFLMDDDLPVEEVNDVSNPFLMQGNEEDENPFTNQAINPFAGFGDDDDGSQQVTNGAPPTTVADIFMTSATAVGDNDVSSIDPAMSFFGTTIIEEEPPQISDIKNPQLAQFDDGKDAYSSEEELNKKKLPPRPAPPSQTTQELIFAVADQLDQASSQMLGRLPATRTPSPVSMRDLHSPSPSPVPDAAIADLLDVSDDSQLPSQSGGFEIDLMSNDNPFAAPTSVPSLHGAAPNMTEIKAQPNRPPPPRPTPPRPTPPAVSSQPVQADSNSQEPDLFDMFGDPTPKPSRPPAPKTTEDILSLFAATKPQQQPQQAQPDLLSGDILLDSIPVAESALPPPFSDTLSQPIIPPSTIQPLGQSEPVSSAQTIVQEDIKFENEIILSQTSLLDSREQPTTTITEPVESDSEPVELEKEILEDKIDEKPAKDSIAPEITQKRAPTPDIEITTVEDLPRSDDEEEQFPPPPPPEADSEIEKIDSDQSESMIVNQPPSSPMDTNIPDHTSEPEQMDTGLDFAPSIPSGSASANPFASPESEEAYPPVLVPAKNIFASEEPLTATPVTNIFAAEEPLVASPATNIFAEQPIVTNIFATNSVEPNKQIAASVATNAFGLEPSGADEFDAFSAKFESVKKEDVLLDGFGGTTPTTADAWGNSDAFGTLDGGGDGFGAEDGFDPFLSMQAPAEPDSPEDKEFSVVIRPKSDATQGIAPILAPPPPPPRGSQNNSIYSGDSSPRVNPFDKGDDVSSADGIPAIPEPASMQRTDSQETPPTPLFDEDVSQPLEDFPRLNYTGPGWEMQLRQPNKKKTFTGQRFWKKVFLRLVFQGDNPIIQLYNQKDDKQPFQELPLQPSYSVSDIGAQQYDQFGKIFTVKLQYTFYKERPGVRPGQVTKAERITNKLSQFAAYAIQGDYQGVKEFGSDLKKLGLPVEHAPQFSQLFKIGSMSYEDLKQFSICVDEALFKLSAHRDRALTYKMEEVQVTAVDEIYVEQDAEGHVHKQIARVRLFFLAFLSGMPTIELGLNDLVRQGKEVVGRHDIIPVVTEEWIRLEGVEFHSVVQQDEYERTRTIKFQPPDGCYIELMRFRVRPPKNRELPFQLKATWCVTGNRVELRADVLVPGFASRKLGQIPCEDVSIRFPIPECWIYLFRVEKHFRYGSVKSAHRRTGKIKGIERILGAVDQLQESLIEVTSGQAKYEHHHRALVWRCPRLPKEGQGAYTTHQLVCRMALTSYDQIPEQLAPYCYVEFTMPATQVSHTTVRSVSVQESDSDEPPEKYVRYLARHEYRVGIEHTTGESQNPYLAATKVKEERPAPPQPVASPMAPSDSDSESN